MPKSEVFDLSPKSCVRSVEDLTLDELSSAVSELRRAGVSQSYEDWTQGQRERVGNTLTKFRLKSALGAPRSPAPYFRHLPTKED